MLFSSIKKELLNFELSSVVPGILFDKHINPTYKDSKSILEDPHTLT